MNIMKTNMLSIDNRIKKDDAGNTTVQAPVPSTVQTEAGMKALMFQGMQNLMANPMLARETGVMNDEPKAEDDSAKSYVAPFSSNIAFQGKFANAAKVATVAALLALGTASCSKVEQTVIVDMEPVVNAINALREDMYNYNSEQQAAMQKALNALIQIQASIQNQTYTIEGFRDMVEGRMINGEFQRSQLLDAIMTLQGITEDSARAIVNTILLAYEQGRIDFQTAMSQIQALLKTNNDLLSQILSEIKSARANADKYAQSLLAVAQEINNNGKVSISQRETMIIQNNALIDQNNILINQGQQLIQKADELKMSVDELTAVAKLIGKSLEDVMKMSKAEIIDAIRAAINELQITNNKLDNINNKISGSTASDDDIKQAAAEIIQILSNISDDVSEIKGDVSALLAKFDALQAQIANLTNIAAKSYREQKFQSAVMVQIRNGIGALYADAQAKNKALKEISDKLDKGGTLTAAEMEEIAKRLNGNIQASLGEIASLIKAELRKEDTQIAYLASIANKLDGLGSLSQAILLEISNMGDDLSNLASIDSKLDELITLFKNYTKQFDKFAKNTMDAHAEEIALLNNIKAEFPDVKSKLQTLINQGKKAELQRANIESYLATLEKQADKIIEKLGRIPTVEEFDIMLNKHDADNQKYYGDLIKAAGVDPSEFADIKALLKAINTNLVDFQGESTKLLADILARIKAMDTTAPDYNEKLDKIIDLMKNFKFECNCKCDCDNNHQVHEGIIGVLAYNDAIINSMFNDGVLMANNDIKKVVREFIDKTDDIVKNNTTEEGPIKGSTSYEFYKRILG